MSWSVLSWRWWEGSPIFSITPEIILAFLAPPLVFEAAFHDKVISEEVYAELAAEVDVMLIDQANPWPELEQSDITEDGA